MAGQGSGAKQKGRKLGRNRKGAKNLRYISQNRRDENKKRRIARMMRRFPKYQLPPGWKRSQMRAGDIVRDR